MAVFAVWALLVSVLTVVNAQVPGFGACPGYVPMTNFEVNKFLGRWYESERMFQLLETASRCVTINYSKGIDGKIRVTNHITGRITGIQRILEGEVKAMARKGEGKMMVKYTVPVTIDTEYSILDTDYTSYAVLWHCSNLVPFFNTQNAWIITRNRLAHGKALKRAYSVLEKYNIPRSNFSPVGQEDCDGVPSVKPFAEEKKEQETKVQDTKVQEVKMQDAKMQETKGQETKMQETKVEETKVQETKVQETKVQETKVQETKVQETKVKAEKE